MAKSTKIIAALGVAGMLGTIALPTFAAEGVKNAVTDNINIEVEESCKISAEDKDNAGDYLDSGATYGATIKNGEANDDIATHKFKVVCNNTTGYEVKAQASDLTAGTSNDITFKAASSYSSDDAATTEQGEWTAEVLNANNTTVFNAIAKDSAARVMKNTGSTDTDGDTFSVKYKAYVGTKTPAGTYAGTVVYTLSTPAGA